jgi:thiamine pyrophosphate-dependent acetolactate synthase large subunit-like protein
MPRGQYMARHASLTRLAVLPATTNTWSTAALADHQRSFQSALRPKSESNAASKPASFTAYAAIDAVRRTLPRDGILSFDVGAHTHQIASQWTAHAPMG